MFNIREVVKHQKEIHATIDIVDLEKLVLEHLYKKCNIDPETEDLISSRAWITSEDSSTGIKYHMKVELIVDYTEKDS